MVTRLFHREWAINIQKIDKINIVQQIIWFVLLIQVRSTINTLHLLRLFYYRIMDSMSDFTDWKNFRNPNNLWEGVLYDKSIRSGKNSKQNIFHVNFRVCLKSTHTHTWSSFLFKQFMHLPEYLWHKSRLIWLTGFQPHIPSEYFDDAMTWCVRSIYLSILLSFSLCFSVDFNQIYSHG